MSPKRCGARAGPELSEDDPFYEFFRRFGQIPRPRGAPDREFDQQSVGSGFIISSDGYLITNAHVVDGADEVTVKLTDKREFKAKVDRRGQAHRRGAPEDRSGKDLPKVTIGDPEKLRVGEWVVAIGKPFGLENTMTAGIVSAKGRDLPQENLVPFIQTDAAVNPGNSGGPLFNLKGEVIGINSMIFSRTGGYMGLSFAIPIDLAMNSVAQLKEKGRVTRGRIGVQITEVSKETAESFGLPRAVGALVNSVEKGGPAEKAGVEAGDIVIKADGKRGAHVLRAAADRHDDQAGQQGHAHGLAQGSAAGDRGDGRGDQGGRPRDARAQGRTGAEGKGQAQPAGSRAGPTSPTSRERSSTGRPAC